MKKSLDFYKENAEEDYLTTPISVLKYIQRLEENRNISDGLLVLIFCFILFCGIFIGQKYKQQEIENRAKKVNKECITNQELEVIVFGEKQE